MAQYLVIHTPVAELETAAKPTDLLGLAMRSVNGAFGARWIKTWSPDLHDERQFTIWEAENAAEIRAVLDAHGFFSEAETEVIRVREWGPEEILESHAGPE